MLENNENNDLNKEPNKFGLPKGYFKNSANSIIHKIEWIEEHKAYTYLNSLKKESGFIVPAEYFNENEIKLELIEFPTLFNLNKTVAFKTPSNYFEELETLQLSNLLVEEENELVAFKKLSTVKKQNNFKVNEDYFNASQQKLAATLLNDKKETKVIKLFSAKVWYAAAAVLTITLGLWVYNQFYKVEEFKDCGTLACVDKIDLVKAKHLESLDNDELYELVDTKKLEKKLHDKTDTKTETKNDKKDLDTSLKNVSTDDLLDEI
ncbi:MAG: hypothetical protein H0U95_12470 [Bacteroidetes bacterium]|nr:hypothetical protein [Bacteroidota bacterium]